MHTYIYLSTILQVFEESRNHRRHSCSSNKLCSISSAGVQKPIKKTRKQRWWNNAMHFFKRKHKHTSSSSVNNNNNLQDGTNNVRTRSPLYFAESRSGSNITPYHRTSNNRKGDHLNIPYIGLHELDMDEAYKFSVSPMPIYLVT